MTTSEQPTFQELFGNILKQAEAKYIKKREKHGDSWQTCDIDYLEKRLNEKVKKLNDATLPEPKSNEMVDIINFSLMLGARWYKEHYEEWRRTPVR